MTAVTLRPMTAAEFAAWFERSAHHYAQDRARADNRPIEKTLREAEAAARTMLPDGQATADHDFFRIVADDAAVGWLWLGPDAADAAILWVYDIEVEESQWGRGIGRAAMLASEAIARHRGARDLELNVFGHNPRAIALYQSLGYATVAMTMRKPVAG